MSWRKTLQCLSIGMVVGVLFVPVDAFAQACGKDTDCKGGRLCQDGACVDTAPTPAPAPEAPPPAVASPLIYSSHSFANIGGVGDFLSPTYGGINIEGQETFHFFAVPNFDGGLTLNLLDDFGFRTPRAVLVTVQGGLGFDLGLFHILQFGPRVNAGYGADVVAGAHPNGAFLTVGGHANLWFNPFVGFYVDADDFIPLTSDGLTGWRFAGGLSFPWG